MDEANELSEMEYDEVSLVTAGANHNAHVVLAKMQPSPADVLISRSNRRRNRRRKAPKLPGNSTSSGRKRKGTTQKKPAKPRTPGSLAHTARGAKRQLNQRGRLRPDNRFSKGTLSAIEKARSRH